MFKNLDIRYLGYTPDAGHITAGGMNAVDVISNNLSIVKHVHFKDCSNDLKWRKMGEGDIDFPKIVCDLVNYGYNGWIMVEEETPETVIDPDTAIFNIYKYVKENLLPITESHEISDTTTK